MNLMRILKRASEPACQCHWHGNDGKWTCCWCGTETYDQCDNNADAKCWRRGEDSFTAWIWQATDKPQTTTPRHRAVNAR